MWIPDLVIFKEFNLRETAWKKCQTCIKLSFYNWLKTKQFKTFIFDLTSTWEMYFTLNSKILILCYRQFIHNYYISYVACWLAFFHTNCLAHGGCDQSYKENHYSYYITPDPIFNFSEVRVWCAPVLYFSFFLKFWFSTLFVITICHCFLSYTL